MHLRLTVRSRFTDDLELADMLLRAGAKPDVTNREGITPLHMACLYGSFSTCEYCGSRSCGAGD